MFQIIWIVLKKSDSDRFLSWKNEFFPKSGVMGENSEVFFGVCAEKKVVNNDNTRVKG